MITTNKFAGQWLFARIIITFATHAFMIYVELRAEFMDVRLVGQEW